MASSDFWVLIYSTRRRIQYIYASKFIFSFPHYHWALPFLGLRRIKKDDKLIKAEGVESLSEAELRQACRYRGMLQLGSVEEMRQQVICSFINISHHAIFSGNGIKQTILFVNNKNDLVFGTSVVLDVKLEIQVISDLQIIFFAVN